MDTTELLKISRDKSVEGREKLAKSVTSLFMESDGVMSDRERSLMLDILHRLVHDFGKSVRAIIAKNLKDWSDIPQDLATFLANDDIDVAYPILSKSGILKDENLIEIIHHRTMEHQMAIAIRQSVSENVSSALVEEGNPQVITKLLENPSAEISKTAFEYIVDEAQRVDSYREPILRREELDSKLAQKLCLWVSAAMRQHITDQFSLDIDVIDALLEKSAREIFATRPADAVETKISDELANQIAGAQDMDPEFMISVLNQGEVNLFMSLFKNFTGLRVNLIRRIIFEPGGEGLAIACKAIGLCKSDFTTIYAKIRRSVPSLVTNFDQEIRKILNFFDSFEVETAKKVLGRWKLDSNYLAAIRELEIGSG